MDNLRILIADDHHLIRRGIRDLLALKRGWSVVAEASDGRDALRLAAGLKPDIAILDFCMPHLNGPGVSSELARVSARTKVVILTMHDSEETIREVVDSGARGFVLKSDADQDLIGAVEAVSEGRRFFSYRVSERLLSENLNRKPTSQTGSASSQLTLREREVMALLANGMTSREVATQLKISVRTAESHRININRKFHFKSIAELVRYAIRYNIAATS